MASSIDEAVGIAAQIGYPVVLRPAFTLGGTGGGFADNEQELREMMRNALFLSPVHQVLIEKRDVYKRQVSGSEAVRALDDCICSKVFFGVDGIDLEHGITTSTIEEAKLTRRMMEAASQTIVLADSSKFGQRGFGRIGSLEEIDVLVTEAEVSEQMASALEEAGVDLIVVK